MTEARTYMGGHTNLITPRDWQIQAQAEAADGYAAKIAEAKRYGAMADALEAAQAENAQWRVDFKEMVIARDAALARLAELEKQEPMTAPPGYKFVVVPEVEESEPDWDEVRRQSEVATGLRVEKNTYSIIIREVRRWIASTYAAAGASPVEPSQEWKPALSPATISTAPACLNTNDKAMWVLGWNECLNAQPPAPSDTAITYMTGYSDGREWAGATNQAQPERAPLSDAEIEDLLGEANRGYCIDKVDYFKAFRDAEQAYGIKQGGQHD